MIELFPDRCQPLRYLRAGCRICVDACPLECIEFKEDNLKIKKGLCNGCGICTTVCPSGALTLKYLSERSLLERLKRYVADEKAIALVCHLGQYGKREKRGTKSGNCLTVVSLPCLGVLKEAHLIGMVISGRCEVYIDIGSCKECSYDYGRKAIVRIVSYAKNLLNAFGIDGSRILLSNGPSMRDGLKKRGRMWEILPDPLYSRREVFTSFRGSIKRAFEPISNKEREKETGLRELASHVPEKRMLLLEILRGLGKPNKEILNEKDLQALNLSIGKDCTFCYYCELFCPTGAIKRVEWNGGVRIDFTSAYCTFCYECEDLCPEKAINVEDSVDLFSFIERRTKTLRQKEKVKCSMCENSFLPKGKEDACLSCSRKRDIDRNFLDMIRLS